MSDIDDKPKAATPFFLKKIIGIFRNSDGTVNLIWFFVVWAGILASRWYTTEKLTNLQVTKEMEARAEPVRLPNSRSIHGRVVSANLIADSSPPQYKMMMEDATLPHKPDGTVGQIEIIMPESSYTKSVQPGRVYEFLLETSLKSIVEVIPSSERDPRNTATNPLGAPPIGVHTDHPASPNGAVPLQPAEGSASKLPSIKNAPPISSDPSAPTKAGHGAPPEPPLSVNPLLSEPTPPIQPSEAAPSPTAPSAPPPPPAKATK